MTKAVRHHRGIINKFLGDGAMAVFRAPVFDDFSCEHAVTAATEFLIELKQAVIDRRISPTQAGIDVHFGAVFTGLLVRMRGVNLR